MASIPDATRGHPEEKIEAGSSLPDQVSDSVVDGAEQPTVEAAADSQTYSKTKNKSKSDKTTKDTKPTTKPTASERKEKSKKDKKSKKGAVEAMPSPLSKDKDAEEGDAVDIDDPLLGSPPAVRGGISGDDPLLGSPTAHAEDEASDGLGSPAPTSPHSGVDDDTLPDLQFSATHSPPKPAHHSALLPNIAHTNTLHVCVGQYYRHGYGLKDSTLVFTTSSIVVTSIRGGERSGNATKQQQPAQTKDASGNIISAPPPIATNEDAAFRPKTFSLLLLSGLYRQDDFYSPTTSTSTSAVPESLWSTFLVRLDGKPLDSPPTFAGKATTSISPPASSSSTATTAVDSFLFLRVPLSDADRIPFVLNRIHHQNQVSGGSAAVVNTGPSKERLAEIRGKDEEYFTVELALIKERYDDLVEAKEEFLAGADAHKEKMEKCELAAKVALAKKDTKRAAELRLKAKQADAAYEDRAGELGMEMERIMADRALLKEELRIWTEIQNEKELLSEDSSSEGGSDGASAELEKCDPPPPTLPAIYSNAYSPKWGNPVNQTGPEYARITATRRHIAQLEVTNRKALDTHLDDAVLVVKRAKLAEQRRVAAIVAERDLDRASRIHQQNPSTPPPHPHTPYQEEPSLGDNTAAAPAGEMDADNEEATVADVAANAAVPDEAAPDGVEVPKGDEEVLKEGGGDNTAEEGDVEAGDVPPNADGIDIVEDAPVDADLIDDDSLLGSPVPKAIDPALSFIDGDDLLGSPTSPPLQLDVDTTEEVVATEVDELAKVVLTDLEMEEARMLALTSFIATAPTTAKKLCGVAAVWYPHLFPFNASIPTSATAMMTAPTNKRIEDAVIFSKPGAPSKTSAGMLTKFLHHPLSPSGAAQRRALAVELAKRGLEAKSSGLPRRILEYWMAVRRGSIGDPAYSPRRGPSTTPSQITPNTTSNTTLGGASPSALVVDSVTLPDDLTMAVLPQAIRTEVESTVSEYRGREGELFEALTTETRNRRRQERQIAVKRQKVLERRERKGRRLLSRWEEESASKRDILAAHEELQKLLEEHKAARAKEEEELKASAEEEAKRLTEEKGWRHNEEGIATSDDEDPATIEEREKGLSSARRQLNAIQRDANKYYHRGLKRNEKRMFDADPGDGLNEGVHELLMKAEEPRIDRDRQRVARINARGNDTNEDGDDGRGVSAAEAAIDRLEAIHDKREKKLQRSMKTEPPKPLHIAYKCREDPALDHFHFHPEAHLFLATDPVIGANNLCKSSTNGAGITFVLSDLRRRRNEVTNEIYVERKRLSEEERAAIAEEEVMDWDTLTIPHDGDPDEVWYEEFDTANLDLEAMGFGDYRLGYQEDVEEEEDEEVDLGGGSMSSSLRPHSTPSDSGESGDTDLEDPRGHRRRKNHGPEETDWLKIAKKELFAKIGRDGDERLSALYKTGLSDYLRGRLLTLYEGEGEMRVPDGGPQGWRRRTDAEKESKRLRRLIIKGSLPLRDGCAEDEESTSTSSGDDVTDLTPHEIRLRRRAREEKRRSRWLRRKHASMGRGLLQDAAGDLHDSALHTYDELQHRLASHDRITDINDHEEVSDEEGNEGGDEFNDQHPAVMLTSLCSQPLSIQYNNIKELASLRHRVRQAMLAEHSEKELDAYLSAVILGGGDGGDGSTSITGINNHSAIGSGAEDNYSPDGPSDSVNGLLVDSAAWRALCNIHNIKKEEGGAVSQSTGVMDDAHAALINSVPSDITMAEKIEAIWMLDRMADGGDVNSPHPSPQRSRLQPPPQSSTHPSISAAPTHQTDITHTNTANADDSLGFFAKIKKKLLKGSGEGKMRIMPTPQEEGEDRGHSMAELHGEQYVEGERVGMRRTVGAIPFESDLDAPLTNPHIQHEQGIPRQDLSTTSIPRKSTAVTASTDALDLLLLQDDNEEDNNPSPIQLSPTPSNHHDERGGYDDGDQSAPPNPSIIAYPLPVRLQEGSDRLRLLAPSWALVDTGEVEVVDGSMRVVQALRVVAILDWAPTPNTTTSSPAHQQQHLDINDDSDDSDIDRRIHALQLKRDYAVSDERGGITSSLSSTNPILSVAGIHVSNIPMHQSAAGSGTIVPTIPALIVLTKEQFAANQHILHPSADSLPSAPKYLGAEVFMPIDGGMTVYNGGVRRTQVLGMVERYSLVEAIEGGVTYEPHPASDTIPHGGRCITASVPLGLGLVMQFEEIEDCRRVGGQLMLALDEV